MIRIQIRNIVYKRDVCFSVYEYIYFNNLRLLVNIFIAPRKIEPFQEKI
jgi:hypothetical protein